MNEEEEAKRKAEEEAKKSSEPSSVSDPEEGDKSKTLTLYERTNEATERLEKANAKTEENLKRQEKLYEIQKLSGDGGGRVETQSKEETPKEYNDRIEKEISEGKHDDD